MLALKGLVEFRGYHPASGSWQVVLTTEFADLAAWAAATESEAWQKTMSELRAFVLDVYVEVWGPSPMLPDP